MAKTTEQLEHALAATHATGVELRAVEVVGEGSEGSAASASEVERVRSEVTTVYLLTVVFGYLFFVGAHAAFRSTAVFLNVGVPLLCDGSFESSSQALCHGGKVGALSRLNVFGLGSMECFPSLHLEHLLSETVSSGADGGRHTQTILLSTGTVRVSYVQGADLAHPPCVCSSILFSAKACRAVSFVVCGGGNTSTRQTVAPLKLSWQALVMSFSLSMPYYVACRSLDVI